MYETRPNRLDVQELTAAGAGAAYGTAKAGIGIAGIGTYRPDLIMKVRSCLWRLWELRLTRAVAHPHRHVRYLGRLRPRHIRPHR